MSPHPLLSGPGSAWALAVLLLIALGLGGLLVPFILHLRGKRPPGMLWLVPTALVALVGLLGTLSTLEEIHAALAAASPELRALLMARGLAQSITTLSLAGGGIAVLGLFAAGGVGLASVIQPGPAPRLRPAQALLGGGAAVALIGGSLAFAVTAGRELGFLAWLPPALLLFTSPSIALAALRASDAEGWTDSAPAHIAAAGMCALVSLLGAALYLWGHGSSEAFSALAMATPEHRDTLWQAAQEIVRLGASSAAVAGLISALAAGAIALTYGARALSPRNLVQAALMLIPLLVVLGSAAFAVAQLEAASDLLLTPSLVTPAEPPHDAR